MGHAGRGGLTADPDGEGEPRIKKLLAEAEQEIAMLSELAKGNF